MNRPPSTWVRRVLIGAVRSYRFAFSPWVGHACRFEPTCSAYALEALDLHGAAGGSFLAARRVLRCHPLCRGGHDPVPPKFISTGTPSAPAAGSPRTDPIDNR